MYRKLLKADLAVQLGLLPLIVVLIAIEGGSPDVLMYAFPFGAMIYLFLIGIFNFVINTIRVILRGEMFHKVGTWRWNYWKTATIYLIGLAIEFAVFETGFACLFAPVFAIWYTIFAWREYHQIEYLKESPILT